MKTKIKRHYRSVVSVLLSVCMLVSCMTVGLIATDAAKITEGDSVAAAAEPDGSVGASIDADDSVGKDYTEFGTIEFKLFDSSWSQKVHVSNATQNEYYDLEVASEGEYYLQIFVKAKQDDATWVEKTLNVKLDKDGDYVKSTSGSLESWSSDVKSTQLQKYKQQTYKLRWKSVQSVYNDANYQLKLQYEFVSDTSPKAVTVVDTDSKLSSNSVGFKVTDGTTDITTATTENLNQGTITVEADIPSDTDYKVTATLSTGSWSSAFTKGDTKYSGTFTLGTTPVTVTFDYVEIPKYYISVSANNASYGDVEIVSVDGAPYSPNKGYDEGAAVVVKATPKAGHPFSSWNKGANTSKTTQTYTINASDANASNVIQLIATFTTNHYEAKAASSLTNNSNIFSNLSATFYDYYYDTEVSGGWKNYSNSYSQDDPYKKLNKALAEYGKGNSVQIPLYLGNLWYVVDGYNGSNSSSTYTTDYNFYWAPNNASGMNALYSLGGVYNYSITGLSGKKLSNGMITHFDSNGTDQNGAPMALFDEDWLTYRSTYEDSTNGNAVTNYSYDGALATIIDSPFPVVKRTVRRVFFDNSGANSNWLMPYAYAFDDSNNIKLGAWPGTPMSKYEGDIWYIDVDTSATKIIFSSGSGTQTVNISIPTSGNDVWKATGLSEGKLSGSFSASKGDPSKTYTYYGFNSTGGEDNAWFTGLNDLSNLKMNYGEGASNAVHDSKGAYGCFPFDGEDRKGNDSERGHNYGFGMKMDIDFTLGQNGKINGMDQVFDFSGDDDLWVYLDGELILDLGGAHAKTVGSINFATGKVNATLTRQMSSSAVTSDSRSNTVDSNNTKVYTKSNNQLHDLAAVSAVTRNGDFSVDTTSAGASLQRHTLTLYYMERGMSESNLRFGFSISPVSNEFLTEKQLDTSNVNKALQSNVEDDVKDDQFSFSNQWSADNSTYSNVPQDKTFSVRDKNGDAVLNEGSAIWTTDNSGIIPGSDKYFSIGDVSSFVDQFTVSKTSPHYFKISENQKEDNSAYTYSPTLTVKDVVTGNNISPEASGGYKFLTTQATSANYNADTYPTRIKAIFSNAIATQDVTITKAISSDDIEEAGVDPKKFRIKVEVQLPGESGYTAYALAYTKGGSPFTLDSSGTAVIEKDQTITLTGIPQGSSVKVTEIADDGTYTFKEASVIGASSGTATGGFVIGAETAAVTVTNRFSSGKNVKIYKYLTSGTSSKDYTMYIKTITALNDASPADYTGTYTIKTVSGDEVVGTANQTYTSDGVSITTGQYILLENVSTSTKLEITERELSSEYARAFHYAYSKFGAGGAATTQVTAVTGDPIKVDNGIRFSVSDDSVVEIYNKPWAYYIRYNYPAYLARYYSTTPPEQWYDKSGTFTDADFDEGGLLTIGMENDSNSVEHPCPVFKDKANSYASIKDGLSNFITQKAPYEDNFMSTITWAPKFVTSGDDTKNTDITYYPTEDNSNVYISTHANEHPNKTVYAYFRLPYNHDSWNIASGKRLDPIETDGKVLKTNWVNYKVETQYGKWITLNGATTKSEAQWVEAAPEIYDSTEGKYYVFDYWQMTSVGKNDSFIDVDNKTSPARLHELKLEIPYKRCYNTGFYMTMYQDSYVEAIYVEKGTDRANMTQQQKEAADTNQISNGAVINFLENSRNQWNNNGGTLYGESYENIASRIAKGDRIFSDFLLSFHMDNDITLAGDLSNTVKEPAKDEQGNTVVDAEGNPVMVDKSYPILKGGSETVNYQIGVVIERVGELSKNGDNYVVETQDTYKTRYDAEEALVNQKNNVINYLNGTNPDSKYLKDEFSAKALDNKNEMEYSYSLPVNNSNNRQNYVYRAFAYLKDYTIDPNATYTYKDRSIAGAALGPHTGAILRVSDPVYFTIYDMASIKDGETYSGGGQS